MMEGASASGRAVRWKDEVKMENLDQFVMETAPQVFSLRPYRYSHEFFFVLDFLGPRGPLVLPSVGPFVRPFVRKKNLDHLYTGIYAL